MSSLFNFDTPKVEPPTPMPVQNDAKAKEMRRKKLEEMRQRGGRESTVLSDNLVGATGKMGQ